jgi:hypothetical protein
MTAILALGCLLAGFVLGWLLRTIFSLAHISWSQEQMQRKVRYWQREAIRARDIAEQLMQQLSAITGREPEPPDWPTADLS